MLPNKIFDNNMLSIDISEKIDKMHKSLYLYLEICIHAENTNHSINKFVKQVGVNDRSWLVSIDMFFRFLIRIEVSIYKCTSVLPLAYKIVYY